MKSAECRRQSRTEAEQARAQFTEVPPGSDAARDPDSEAATPVARRCTGAQPASARPAVRPPVRRRHAECADCEAFLQGTILAFCTLGFQAKNRRSDAENFYEVAGETDKPCLDQIPRSAE